MQIRPVVAELFDAVRSMDGRIDMPKSVVDF